MSSSRDPFRVEIVADYAAALPDLRQVRETVFVQEQNVPASLELDALDPHCLHVLVRAADGEPIGTARLVPPPAATTGAGDATARIGRMAVLAPWRNAGVGTAMLQALLRLARERGWRQVSLHAQASAIEFYRRHGFVAEGAPFEEAGIRHQSMHLVLDQPNPVTDRDAAVAATVAVISASRRHLWIYSRELDPGLLDDHRVLDALRALATSQRAAEVQLLVHDASAPQRAHAPLLALAQRLPSIFALREVADPADRGYVPAFIANDAGGYYFRSLGHRLDGETELQAPGRARHLAETFRPVWERARPCTELRALGF
jgi:predicted GNAT family N-acyltransferase